MNDPLDILVSELVSPDVKKRSALDRYRDFRQVFLNSDEGRRVLSDILYWGRVLLVSEPKDGQNRLDPYISQRREGERSLALRIFQTIHVQPRESRPDRQQTIPEGE